MQMYEVIREIKGGQINGCLYTDGWPYFSTAVTHEFSPKLSEVKCKFKMLFLFQVIGSCYIVIAYLNLYLVRVKTILKVLNHASRTLPTSRILT